MYNYAIKHGAVENFILYIDRPTSMCELSEMFYFTVYFKRRCAYSVGNVPSHGTLVVNDHLETISGAFVHFMSLSQNFPGRR
jgi:hypothetical protein